MENSLKPYWSDIRIITVLCAAAGFLPPNAVLPLLFGAAASVWRARRLLLVLCCIVLGRVYIADAAAVGPAPGFRLAQGETVTAVMELAEHPRPLDARGFLVKCTLVEVIRRDGSRASASGRVMIYVHQRHLPSYAGLGTEAVTELRYDGEQFRTIGTPAFSGPRGTAGELLSGFRHTLRQQVLGRLSHLPWEAGLLSSSLLLGIPFDSRDRLIELCRASGTAHVMALSGLHAGILVHLFSLVLRPVAGRKAAGIICMVLLLCYLWITGFRESLTRAVIMYWIYRIELLRGHRPDGLEVLCRTVLVHMMIFPSHAGSFSFYLSYGALTGIMLLTAMISDALPAWIPPVLRSSMALTASASAGTYPVLLLLGLDIYPAGILLSIPSILLVTLFMWLSLGYLAYPGLEVLAHLLNRIVSLLAAIWEWGSDASDSLLLHPGAWTAGAFLLLTRLVHLQYRSCRRSYEGLSRRALQFPVYDQGSAGNAGTEDEQAAGPELPHQPPCAQEHP